MQNKQTEALKKALTELLWYEEAGLGRISSCDAIHSLREALAEQLAQQQEPVAWWRLAEDDGHQKHPVVSVEKPHPQWTTTRPLVFGDTPSPAQRKPLTDEDFSKLCLRVAPRLHRTADAVALLQAIEAAHGIKE